MIVSRHRATVTNNEDPEKLGRIRIKCETYCDDELPIWVDPMFKYSGSNNLSGEFFIPEVGSEVIVDIHEDVDDLSDLQVFWIGNSYTDLNRPSAKFLASYGKIQGTETPAGGIYFDSTVGNEKIKLESKNGFLVQLEKDKVSATCGAASVVLNIDGSITITGGSISISGSSVLIGNNVTIDGKAFLTHTHSAGALFDSVPLSCTGTTGPIV